MDTLAGVAGGAVAYLLNAAPYVSSWSFSTFVLSLFAWSIDRFYGSFRRLRAGRSLKGLLLKVLALKSLTLLHAIYMISFAVFVATSPFTVVWLIHAEESWLLAAVSDPLFLPVACAGGGGFYVLRGRRPLVYGVIELVAVASAVLLAIGAPQTAGLLSKAVGILGGVYIMIRGLDNIEKGLPDGHRWWWDMLFAKGTASRAP